MDTWDPSRVTTGGPSLEEGDSTHMSTMTLTKLAGAARLVTRPKAAMWLAAVVE